MSDRVERIDRLSSIVRELDTSKLWSEIKSDLLEKERHVDDNWYLIKDEKDLSNMRTYKTAIRYLLDFEKAMKNELKMLQVENEVETKPELNIMRDFDNEGNYEDA